MTKQTENQEVVLVNDAVGGVDIPAGVTQPETMTTDLVAQEMNAVAVTTGGGAYVTELLQGIKTDFLAQNDGLDMDFVNLGTWLVIDKKGNFVEKDDKEASFGDSIDVVIGQGEKRFTLWGHEKSPQEGQLIVAAREEADAIAAFRNWQENNPDAASEYSEDEIKLRYLAFVIPVVTLCEDFPKIYLMSFPLTTTIAFGKWAMGVYQGKYKAVGIPARTGVNRIVTRLITSEKKGEGNNSYIGVDFEAVGMFNPADYKKQ